MLSKLIVPSDMAFMIWWTSLKPVIRETLSKAFQMKYPNTMMTEEGMEEFVSLYKDLTSDKAGARDHPARKAIASMSNRLEAITAMDNDQQKESRNDQRRRRNDGGGSYQRRELVCCKCGNFKSEPHPMHLCKCMHGWIERETPGDKTSNFKVVGLKFRNTPEGKDYSRQCGGDVQKAHIHTNRPADGHFWESTDFPTSPRARRVDAANRHIKDGGRGQPPKIGESSYAAPLNEEMIASMLPPGKFKAFKEKRSGATKSTRRSNASKPNKPKGKGNGKSGHADKVNALFGGLQCMMHFDLEKLRCSN